MTSEELKARQRARTPGIALAVVGMLNGIIGCILVALSLMGLMRLGLPETVIAVIQCLAALTITAGGLNLIRLDGYGLVKTGSITAMVPCISPLFILSLPIGVWALTTAASPDVWEYFKEQTKANRKPKRTQPEADNEPPAERD